ncbi:hypothetical protein OUY_00890 [Wolbachia endosymbiont of Leptopilina clavipes]|nr:hypothetical protein OUY_00890 [Wolbachia endosymbiont of Leptopilina clavipes]
MHGFVSEEGIRHYVVTDGAYEMTLNWCDEDGKKCTIIINIDANGIELIERNRVTDDQLKANKDVKIGNLFLYQIKQLQYVIDKIEESIRENETIKDYSKKIILGEAQKIKFILGQLVQFKPMKGSKTSEETSDSLQEDLGYASRSPTPTRLSCSVSVQSIASGPIPEYGL